MKTYLLSLFAGFELKATLTLILGFIFALMGGLTAGITALFILFILDFITGFSVAVQNKTVESGRMRKGILKFLLYAIAIIAANQVDRALLLGLAEGFDFGTKYIITLYLVSTEAISVFENLSALGVSLPTNIVKVLRKYQEKLNQQ